MKTRLKELRKAAGYSTAEEFARELSISVHTYRKYEQGAIDLYLDVACDIADALGCSLDELVGRTSGSANIGTEERRVFHAYMNLDDRGRAAVDAVVFSLASEGDTVPQNEGRVA